MYHKNIIITYIFVSNAKNMKLVVNLLFFSEYSIPTLYAYFPFYLVYHRLYFELRPQPTLESIIHRYIWLKCCKNNIKMNYSICTWVIEFFTSVLLDIFDNEFQHSIKSILFDWYWMMETIWSRSQRVVQQKQSRYSKNFK